MALLDSEVARIKAELGYNALTVGAVPYVAVTRLFENVIQAYMGAGATTASSTIVTAVSDPSSPSPVTLTLSSATGFTAGDTVIVDVDSRQEYATVQATSGATITVLLAKAHTWTYPVTVEGGETLVREYLTKLRLLNAPGGQFDQAADKSGIEQIDEIRFFGGPQGSAALRDLRRLQRHYRDELASILGVPNLRDGGSGSISVY